MDPIGASFTFDVPPLAWLAFVIVGGVLAAMTYWRRHRPSDLAPLGRQALAAKPGMIVYNDAPTVRVVDSQRVGRMRKVVRMTAGESVDILEHHMGTTPPFRITLLELTERDGPAARIAVEFGGTRLSCGPAVREVAVNEFVLPRATREEPRSSIFHFDERGDALDFTRIKLRTIDAASSTAELDVLQVSGHWPVAESG